MPMTFNLIRWGFPNSAAILALAALPFVATIADWQPRPSTTGRIATAAICPAASDCATVAAGALPELILE
jgi:hypothetical protein